MGNKIKNLFIGLGPGYHHQVRTMHSMIKDKCDSSMLFFHIEKNVDSIGDDLRFHYSMGYKDFPKTFDAFKTFIKEKQFDLIGLGFMSHHWDIYVELSKAIREVLPNCKIIAGGVHAWHVSQSDTLKYCDYICAAEGEELYVELIDRLSNKTKTGPLSIPGLIEKYEKKVIHNPVKTYMPLDKIPFPTYGDKQTYSINALNADNPIVLNEDFMVDGHWGFVHIGRGCVFRCTFCINAIHKDPTVRLRSVDRVIDEIKDMLSKCKNTKVLFFEDEIFPVKGNFLREFCEKYKKEINLPFWVCLYPHMLSEEKLKLLKDAGLVEITMGLQSGSQRIRNEIYDRKDKNEMILKENSLLSKHDVMTYYDLIIRNPWEKEEDLDEALELINALKRPFYLKIYTLAYYPKHPITIRALKEKMIDPKEVDATIGYLAVTTPHKVLAEENYWEDSFVVWHNKLRKRMLQGTKDDKYFLLMAYHGFWFIPKFLLNILYKRFKKKSKWELYLFSYLLEKVLLIRGLTVTQYILIVKERLKQRGFIYVISKIFSKVKSKLTRSIVTTSSGNVSVMEEVLYKRK